MKLNRILLATWISTMGGLAWADPPQQPKNVNAEPTTLKSAALTSRAASAEMIGNPQSARTLAERAIAANPRDPWGYYDRVTFNICIPTD